MKRANTALDCCCQLKGKKYIRLLPHYFLFFLHLFSDLLQFFDQFNISAVHPGVYHINRHG